MNLLMHDIIKMKDHDYRWIGALGKFTNEWNLNGVSIVFYGWTNVKGKPLINILGVSASGAIFLSSHDYSDRYKTSINIADALLKTIQEIVPYNVIQIITIMLLIVRQQEQSLKIGTPIYFGSHNEPFDA